MANITDTQLRGIALKKAYDRRSEGFFAWTNDDFKDLDPTIDFDINDLFRICDQLRQAGLIEFKSVSSQGRIVDGRVKIAGAGVDVIEGNSKPPIAINLDQSRHITITSSSNVQVGDFNKQEVRLHVESLLRAVEASSAPPEQKKEAKNLLQKFLEHPLVTSVAGGAVSGLVH